MSVLFQTEGFCCHKNANGRLVCRNIMCDYLSKEEFYGFESSLLLCMVWCAVDWIKQNSELGNTTSTVVYTLHCRAWNTQMSSPYVRPSVGPTIYLCLILLATDLSNDRSIHRVFFLLFLSLLSPLFQKEQICNAAAINTRWQTLPFLFSPDARRAYSL